MLPVSGTLAFALHAVDLCVSQVVNEIYGDSLGVELDDLPLHSGQYHMVEFAKKYFREAQRNRRSDTHMCSVKNKKGLEGFSVKLKFALTVINK